MFDFQQIDEDYIEALVKDSRPARAVKAKLKAHARANPKRQPSQKKPPLAKSVSAQEADDSDADDHSSSTNPNDSSHTKKTKRPQVNWMNPIIWREIYRVGNMHKPAMNSVSIQNELRKRNPIFKRLTARQITRWIMYPRNGAPYWDPAALLRAAKGSTPGGQGGRKGILVRASLVSLIHLFLRWLIHNRLPIRKSLKLYWSIYVPYEMLMPP